MVGQGGVGVVGQGGVGVDGQGGGARRARDVRLRQHRTLSFKTECIDIFYES